METTLSYNRQLFNVKDIAVAGLSPAAIPDNTLGIIDVYTDKTVVPTSFEDLPKKFRLIYKHEGKVIYGFDCIEKKNIVWAKDKEYKKAKLNKWEGVIKHCNCIDVVKLTIFVQDDRLNRRNGLPWGANDFYVEVAPAEFECYCSCNETGAYANNVLTMLLYKQLLKQNSSFYTVSVETVDGGTKFNSFEEVEKFVQDNKEININKDKNDDGQLLKLVIEAKPVVQPRRFNPYNTMHSYPAGTKLFPSAEANAKTLISFKELVPMEFEIGSGWELVQEEYEDFSYYNNVGTYQRNMNIIEFPEFQFEESKKYDTLTLEFDSPKTLRAGKADMKRFMLIFGSEVALNSSIHKKLVEIFTPA